MTGSTPSTYNPLAGFASETPAQRPFAASQPLYEPEASVASAPEPVEPGETLPPLEDLGMVELVDRFARALKLHGGMPHSAAPASIAAHAAAPGSAPEPIPESTPEPAPVLAAPQRFTPAPVPVPVPAPARPAALTPVAFDDAIGDDAAGDDGSEDDDHDVGSAFSSLLGIRTRPPGNEGFVRVEEAEEVEGGEHPIVVFPGQEARAAKLASEVGKPQNFDPVAPFGRPFDTPDAALDNAYGKKASPQNANDTERALRDALEKLQRMSGTA